MHELATEKDKAGDGTSAVVYVFPWKGLRILPSASDMREASDSAAGSDPSPARVDQDMNETIITLRVVHKKPLPKEAAQIISQRAYSFFYSQGVEVGVSATIAELPKEPGREDK